MKLIFNDATELKIQSVGEHDGYLSVLVLESVSTAEDLRTMFEDPQKTKKLTVQENGQTLGTYEGYTAYYRSESYPGGMLGAVNCKPEKTPEHEAEMIASAVKVAEIQAQELTDEQSLDVQNLFPEWSGDEKNYETGYKVNYIDSLYRCLQAHKSQADWNPEDAPSLWTKVLIPDPTVVPDWEQPGPADNGYKKGDKVKHNGSTWESNVDNNVWEPGVIGTEALWHEVEGGE